MTLPAVTVYIRSLVLVAMGVLFGFMSRFSVFFWRITLTILLLATGLTPTTGAGPEHLTVRNGLPQGFIKSLLQDRRGFVWLATRDGLCRYDGVRFRIYQHDPQRISSLSFSSIYEIREDRRGRLWIRTENNNVDCFDPVTEQTSRISNSAAFRRAVGRGTLVGIAPDQFGNVWVATQTDGFFRLNANGTVSHRNWAPKGDTTQRTLRTLLLDRQGRLYLAATDGLFRYDSRRNQFTGYRTAQGLPANDVWTLHERANGELMLGFPGRFALFAPAPGRVREAIALPDAQGRPPLFARDYRGTDYVNQHRYTDRDGLVRLPISPDAGLADRAFRQPQQSRFPALSLLVDRSNVLWIGTDGDGVLKYDLNKRPFQSWPYATNFQTDWVTRQLGVPAATIPAAIREQGPLSVRYQFDGEETLWLSSPSTAPYRYNSERRQFEGVPPKGIAPRWLPGGAFRLSPLTVGAQGEVWGLMSATGRAVARYNPNLRTFTAFPLPLPVDHPYTVMAMMVAGGRGYMATQSHGLLRADLSRDRLLRWRANSADPESLPINALLSLAQDPLQYNYLWIGTYGSGLCRLDKHTGRIRRFTVSQGLPNNVVYGIRPDGQGHLWLSTNRGLCRFDSRTFEVRNYTADDGLPSDEFGRFNDVSLPDGRLVFGGIGGYTVFDPRRVSDNAFKPTVALTALRINNQLVTATDSITPLRRDINETEEIRLKHDQNFVSVDFAALQFNQSGKNQYRHKLTGVDNDWVYSGNQATATYTNLPPGRYTFIVNASNTSGVWSPHTRQLAVVIEPPLWATWWAYLLYGLLVLGGIAQYLRVRIHRIRLNSRVELREQEAIQLKNLDEIKTRFFANITHEFRTPLTLILSPLEDLMRNTTDAQHHRRLSLVYRNANRLLRLINELLDLAKLEAGNLTVTPTQDDLVAFVERTAFVFNDEAVRSQVTLRVQSQLAQRVYWFDADKVEKILNNLLTNALKFTRANDLITVTLSSPATLVDIQAVNGEDPIASALIRMTVSDTGAGIPRHNLPHIFKRFYQADPDANRLTAGSGIGLAFVKELVDMLKGEITVSSRLGFGTTFTVDLPCRPAIVAPLMGTAEPSVVTTAVPGASADAPRLLIVEDNDDIAGFLTEVLSPHWHIQRVSNGRAGLEAALADGPDLIISDVLMAEMNGFDLCRQLKQNPATDYIPVLLLTAKSAAESRVEGLAAGADDYLTKPFQVEELRWRIRNRLEQQQRLRMHYRTQLLREGHVPVADSVFKDEFMDKVYAELEAQLDNPKFGVGPLSEAVGLSRMHLNRKVKAVTGLTPVELIRVVRLRRAAELLLTSVAVAEVADAVGFDTPAYFSKVFKEHYNLTPSEYAEQNRRPVA